MAIFKVSKYSSLSFYHNWRTPFEIERYYIQKFSITDNIRVQYTITDSISPNLFLTNLTTGEKEVITPTAIYTYEEDEINYTIFEILISGLSVGRYSFEFYRNNDLADRSVFCVLDPDDLIDTVHISYTNRDDNFDTRFIEGEDSYKVFEWRVEGAFMPSETTFFVNNESFRNQRGEETQLSASPYKKDVLTIGDGFGVPVWAAEKLNLAFSLSDIWVDGDSYVRSEGATPQITKILYMYPLYVYKIEVEQLDFYNDIINIPRLKVLGATAGVVLGIDENTGIHISYGNKG
ncbi:hypothetical protein [Dysgonomonas macrotermitis]|uniref:Uncharacterized protein n=1 Tax=Dysgonomonas macrotermitis TaxID=1346286 RepID=A0A1M5C4N6_9BACT|nr:hypothetical protein [Dysgonomonas macrotermitis]SHF49640.1 hypothetical protein SAMN05444362_10728 [Dysgonomonas macrotermitis]